MSGYPMRYEDMLNSLDEVWRLAEHTRKKLASIDAQGNAADAMQLGKAIALIYVAETAAKDAASTIGRTTKTIWGDV